MLTEFPTVAVGFGTCDCCTTGWLEAALVASLSLSASTAAFGGCVGAMVVGAMLEILDIMPP